MDPRPTNYLRQNIVFSYPKMIRVCFSLFLSLSVFCYFTLLLIFIKIILLLLLLLYLFIFMKIIFIFSCSGMFRNVPVCSGMFRNVPCSGLSTPKIKVNFDSIPCVNSYEETIFKRFQVETKECKLESQLGHEKSAAKAFLHTLTFILLHKVYKGFNALSIHVWKLTKCT